MTQKIKLLLIVSIIVVVVNGLFAAVYFYLISPSEPVDEPTAVKPKPKAEQPAAITALDDKYYSIHFSFNDAVELCIQEARSRNSNIIQLSMNELSTRYNKTTNMYKVMLDSHVGTPLLYDEKGHTCDIDPEIQGVAFYREIVRRTVVRPAK